MELLAIMGRGIQMSGDGWDPTDVSSWVPTRPYEITDEQGMHLSVRHPRENRPDVYADPQARIGGGLWNLRAGVILIKRHHPNLVVCAYGHRSSYLTSVDGPTESEVMHYHLGHECKLGDTKPLVWPRERTEPGPSNTGSEIKHVLDLGLERGFRNIAILTVGVHVPRTGAYVSKYLTTHPQYGRLNVRILESEEIIAVECPWERNTIAEVRNSLAFEHSWRAEAIGISKIICGVYQDFA